MLRGLQTPKSAQRADLSHEDLFMQRYERLLKVARRMTSGNERAEDLVHNAFVQFILSRPELTSIHDLDGYLLVMLRNMHVSQARRAAIVPTVTLSVTDYDSAEAGLRALDAQAQLQVREQLRLICLYCCRRKERSKIGSALILRFFHGYYPSEVAKVFRSTRDVVDKWLSLARQEALAYVEDPSALKLIENHPEPAVVVSHLGAHSAVFLSELRHSIFATCPGECYAQTQLKEIYSDPQVAVSTAYLSHLVSCVRCLDEVNALLDLPLLAERFPMETFGRHPRPPGGFGRGGGGSTSGGKHLSKLKQVSRRRMSDVVAHRPKELRVAVNGYVLGSQSVSSEANKLALSVNLSERVGFVEIFSEQGVCLLYSDIGAPPDGPLEQFAHAEFSEGRTLDLSLNFTGPWPTVDVLYRDPTLCADQAAHTEQAEIQTQTRAHESSNVESRLPEGTKPNLIASANLVIRRAFGNWRFLFRPSTATAVVAILVLASLFAVKLRRATQPSVTAAALLSQAIANEAAIETKKQQVLHRTISLEERRSSGDMITRQRIEVWRSAEKGITARRFYDDTGQLIAGDWRRADGVQILYHHGTRRLQTLKPESALSTFENVWQLSPSGTEFASLVTDADATRLEERPTSYVISWDTVEPGSRLVRAVLVLSRDDLHATELTLVLRSDDGNPQIREFRFVETSFERRPTNAVAPAVFEPDPQLLGSSIDTRLDDTTATASAPNRTATASPVLATPELQVEVLHLLNQVRADMGEQVGVTLTTGGLLRIEGIVESDQRKAEIMRALGPVLNHSAVVADIKTVAEAVKRTSVSRTPSAPTIIERSATDETVIPVDPELRRFVIGQGKSGMQVDDEVRSITRRVLTRSDQILKHSGALKRLAQQFSQSDLESMNGEARAKFLGLIRTHALALQQQITGLRGELGAIFAGSSTSYSASVSEISDDAQLVRSAEQLFDLCAENDYVVRSAFTISPEADKAPAIKRPAFWRSLDQADQQARAIQRATTNTRR